MSLPFFSTILLATGNPGKLMELRTQLGSAGVDLIGLDSFPYVAEIAETGETFEANATLKAVGYARQTGCLALADDSGLEIDALNGAPGIHSARFGGGIGFDRKMSLILNELSEVSEPGRSARFTCVMALSDADGKILATERGVCEGTIAREPRGSGGFGYDPIFIPNGFDQTFGELERGIKDEISHRAKASAKIMRYLLGFKAV